MQLIDPNHSFYRPLWRRVLIVAFCAAWAGVETWGNQPFWAILSGAAALYSAYVLLLTFDPKDPEPAAPAAVEAEDDEDGKGA